MNKIFDHLYVGSLEDAKDEEQLRRHGITAIVAIHDECQSSEEWSQRLPRKVEGIEYRRLFIDDSLTSDILRHVPEVNSFVHQRRIRNENVLIHCLVGVSRSVCLTIAYVMCITDMGYQEALDYVKRKRGGRGPNPAFRTKLRNFEIQGLKHERDRLREEFLQNGVSIPVGELRRKDEESQLSLGAEKTSSLSSN